MEQSKKQNWRLDLTGSSQTQQNPRVDGYGSGFRPTRSSWSGYWMDLEPNRTFFLIATQTTGGLPGPVANADEHIQCNRMPSRQITFQTWEILVLRNTIYYWNDPSLRLWHIGFQLLISPSWRWLEIHDSQSLTMRVHTKLGVILPHLIYLYSIAIYMTRNCMLRHRYLYWLPCHSKYNPDCYSKDQIN